MKKKDPISKDPIKLYNLTDIAEFWGQTRGMSRKHHINGNIVPDFTHYHGTEIFWETVPEKPKRKKK